MGAGRLEYLFELIEPWCYSHSELIEPGPKANNIPGGRPRKYPDKAAAKAADRFKAVERKAAAKKAPREGHAGSPLTLLELLNVHHVIHLRRRMTNQSGHLSQVARPRNQSTPWTRPCQKGLISPIQLPNAAFNSQRIIGSIYDILETCHFYR